MEQDLHKRHYFINQYKTKTLRFADNQVIIADSEDNLQRGVFTLRNIAKNSGMDILPENSGTMTFFDKKRQDDKTLRITNVCNKSRI